MSLRGLLVLVLLFAALAGWLVWSGRTPKAPAAPAPSAPLLASFGGDELKAVEAACAPGTWTLRRGEGGWRVVEPFDAEADSRRVADLIAGLQDARATREVAGADADLAAFGLAPALCRVELTVGQEGAPRVLRLGRSSPVGTERYAIDVSGRVVLTEGSLLGLFARDAESLRERRLIPVSPEAVTRIALERPQGRLVLEADGGAWRVVEPFRDAASTSACRDLARAIVAIELEDARSAAIPIPTRADRRIAVEVASGDSRSHRAFVAAAGIDGKRVGWRDGSGLIGLLAEAAARELELEPDGYRDKRVTVLSTPEVRWVEVDRPGRTLRVERAGEGAAWSGRDGEAPFVPDAGRVEAFLARLRTLTAVGFEAAAPTPASGSIAAGGEAGDLARFSWGPLPPARGGDGVALWLATPTRPGVVFRVLASDLGPIPAAAADWTSGS